MIRRRPDGYYDNFAGHCGFECLRVRGHDIRIGDVLLPNAQLDHSGVYPGHVMAIDGMKSHVVRVLTEGERAWSPLFPGGLDYDVLRKPERHPPQMMDWSQVRDEISGRRS